MTMNYEVKLNVFEGPLDLLLYLIKKNELDIYDIPIAEITEQYLKYIKIMKSLNLDLAGEYLVLAATLLHIKSRLLLPQEEKEEEEDEGEDPRAELVKQLVTYQAFREAAKKLDELPQLDREVFTRGGFALDNLSGEDTEEIEEVGLFELIDAFQRLLERLKMSPVLEIEGETITIEQKIYELKETIRGVGSITFEDLLAGQKTRREIIYAFLAILEMMRRKMIRAFQISPLSTICLFYEGENVKE